MYELKEVLSGVDLKAGSKEIPVCYDIRMFRAKPFTVEMKEHGEMVATPSGVLSVLFLDYTRCSYRAQVRCGVPLRSVKPNSGRYKCFIS